jgi:hypothetical protein
VSTIRPEVRATATRESQTAIKKVAALALCCQSSRARERLFTLSKANKLPDKGRKQNPLHKKFRPGFTLAESADMHSDYSPSICPALNMFNTSTLALSQHHAINSQWTSAFMAPSGIPFFYALGFICCIMQSK